MTLPLLCYPYENKEKSISRLSEKLKEYPDFCHKKNYISSIESKSAALQALDVRLNILKSVYQNDYHTDCFDYQRLAQRIHEDDEHIWFWGDQIEITKLRNYFKEKNAFILPLLGTVTAISAFDEFSLGTAELCRAGSSARNFKGSPAIIYRVLQFLTKAETYLYDRYHTFILVPRTRFSTENVRGGEAVKKIHTEFIRSRFWGYAPWYVMQGGMLEFLEFREINRDTNDVVKAIMQEIPWYIANLAEADYVKTLCLLNFQYAPTIITSAKPPKINFHKVSASMQASTDTKLRAFNHETLICHSDNNQDLPKSSISSFDTLFSLLLENDSACKVVRLNLLDHSHLSIQEFLYEHGFRLLNISPPKLSWVIHNGQKKIIEQPPYGFWSMPSKNFPLAPPYYINNKTIDNLELNILNYIKNIIEHYV
ncbi:MAG TPA: hypothetical protein VG895_00315 [Patescibacteria group bacterium]|nr:hypothetical protein [Gammaproteobacteria bacterium]HWA51485.1 hypothetical protein [Patescibacteria group bacterium]